MGFKNFVFSYLVFLPLIWASSPVPREVKGIDIVSGKKVDIQSTAAPKATVVVFVSARCPCSASHEIALRELSKEFSSVGFQFIAVHSNTDESAEITKTHFENTAFSFPVVQDEGAKIANDWGALKTPHVFVVSPEGELLYQGGVDDSHSHKNAKKHFLREALSAIRAGKKPDIKITRSLGCVIKR